MGSVRSSHVDNECECLGYNDVTTFLPGYSSIRIEQITPEAESGVEVEARRRRRHRLGDDNYLGENRCAVWCAVWCAVVL